MLFKLLLSLMLVCLLGQSHLAYSDPFVVTKGQATLALAQNGKALQSIVISPQASDDTKANATDLADYLKRITGATFEVKAGDGKTGIVLGNLKEFPDPSLDQPLQIRNHYNGLEAFSIRTESNRILLIGATDLGAAHAVWRFLELLGHRRFFPHPAWDIVPHTPDLKVSFQEDSRPDFLSRRIWYGFGVEPVEIAKAGFQWARQNQMVANHAYDNSLHVSIGHAWTSIETANSAAFKAHPEYYALVKDKDGKMVRRGPQLCMSNPAVRKMVDDYAINQLETKPGSNMVCVGPADGGGLCQCDQCKKLGDGSVSDQVFSVTNEAARAVEAHFPGQGKMVSTYAYSFYTDPPSFALEPNVFVELTVGYNYSAKGYNFDQLADLWSKKITHLGFREYFSVFQWDYDLPAVARASNMAYLRERIPFYIARGGDSISAESSFNWGPNGLGYYVASHLMWNGKTDVDALLTDFYDKAFGPAAAPMKRFYEGYDRGKSPLITAQWHGLALRDLQEASILAKDRPDVLARLDQLKQYMHYVRLRWEYDSTVGSLDDQRAAFVKMMTYNYRVRDNGMDHWDAMRRADAGLAARKLNVPAWNWKKNKGPMAWENNTPWTKADTDQAFADDLKYFPAIDLHDETFSNHLVPVNFGKPVTPPAPLIFQRGNFAQVFYASPTNPIKIRLTPGVVWEVELKRAQMLKAKAQAKKTADNAAKDVPAPANDAAPEDDGADEDDGDLKPTQNFQIRCQLTSQDGKSIFDALFPVDFKPHDIEMKVPATGLYSLRFTGGATPRPVGGWEIQVLSATPHALALPRDISIIFAGRVQDNQLYFYVPKGTKTIQYYSQGDHSIYPPQQSGKPRILIPALPRHITHITEIPVPDGQDGKLWSMKYNLRQPWFFNVPNVFSTSPATMLVPEELAQKDGLIATKP